jgi:hypothetical protein
MRIFLGGWPDDLADLNDELFNQGRFVVVFVFAGLCVSESWSGRDGDTSLQFEGDEGMPGLSGQLVGSSDDWSDVHE